MKLTAIKRLVEEKKMHMEVIVNNKVREIVLTSSTYCPNLFVHQKDIIFRVL